MMLRRPNSPYVKIDLAGRFMLNAYRTAERGARVRPIRSRGSFDVARGVFIHAGRVGIYLALHSNGPAARQRAQQRNRRVA